MNQKIIKYLQDNKNSFSQNLLRDELIKAGYDTSEIEEAINFVYQEAILSDEPTVQTSNKNDNASKKIIIGISIGLLIMILIGVMGIILYKSKKTNNKYVQNANINYSNNNSKKTKNTFFDKKQDNKDNITNYETEGNLRVTRKMGCVSLEEITNQDTPADIVASYAKCVKEGEYEMSAQLDLMGKMYAIFDMMRVSDDTAHQAYTVLVLNNTSNFNQDMMNKANDAWEKMLNSKEKMKEVCSKIKKIGYPHYYPEYMIAHGIGAFSANSGQSGENGLIKNFNAKEKWDETINEFPGGVCLDSYEGGIIDNRKK